MKPHRIVLAVAVLACLAVACQTLARWGGAGAGALAGGAVGGPAGAAVGAIAGDAGGDALVADPPTTMTTINAQPGSTVYAATAEKPARPYWHYAALWAAIIAVVWILKALPQGFFDAAHTIVSLGTNKLAAAVRRRLPVLVKTGSDTRPHSG